MPRDADIRFRAGSTTPSASAFYVGEPAWDSTNKKLYVKAADGTMVEIGASAGGSSTTELVYTAATTTDLPATGDAAKLYITTDTGRVFRWVDSTTKYVEVGPVGGGDTTFWNLFLPPAPTSVSGTTASGQSVVSWTAPTVSAQTPITDYIVQYSSDGGSTWTTFSDGTSTSTSATVTGLTNGTTYKFRVAGVNAIGTGSYSTASGNVTPTAGDTYYANVSLLLHMDGSSGSTSFLDNSANTHSISVAGDAAISTAQSKFGGASGLFSAGRVVAPVSSTFDLGSSDFAIEFFVRFASVASGQRIAGSDSPTSTANFGWAVYMTSNGQLDCYLSSTGSSWNLAAPMSIGSVTTGQWYHVAIARSGTTIRTYLDGTSNASITTSSVIYYNSSNGPFFGGQSGSNFSGHLDEIRITKAARYSGTSLTVPTAAFPNS